MRSVLIVAIGGAVGASARWSVGEMLGSPGDGFPWATFVVNVVGCFMIGLATRMLPRHSDAWLGVVVGVLGGLTTFSAYANETRALVDQGRGVTAVVYVVATIAVGVVATEVALGTDRQAT